MPKGRKQKSDDEFYEESMNFFLEPGAILQRISPDCVDIYNDRSLLKLICIEYWVGIFSPIAHHRFRVPHGYKVAYVDTMAGSGVTSTKRAGDYFCGSCPGAFLSASKFPFDIIIGIEIDKEKAETLKRRLNSISSSSQVIIRNEDILDVSSEIAGQLLKRTISYIVIDPQALQGMTWSGISPLLKCKGDAMITWFESQAWRIKCAALSETEHASAEGNRDRLNELFGDDKWTTTESPEELTQLLIDRILREGGKSSYATVKIEGPPGNYHLMILLTGQGAEKQVNEWKQNVERRIKSAHGRDISFLLDVKAGRRATLREFSNLL